MDDEKMGVGIAETIRSMTDRANAMAAETRLQFDTLVTMQKDERIEMQKLHNEDMDKLRKHYSRIIIGLILTLAIFIGGLFGAVIYFLANYEISTTTFQEVYDEGTINDGIHYRYDYGGGQ